MKKKTFMLMVKNKIMSILLLFLITAMLSCNTTEPDGTKTISLSIEDVSCTEAWLKISGAAGSSLILKRDDKEVKSFLLNTADTTIVDDSLLPNKSYAYQALIKTSGVITGGSPKATATTLDTTSHNFTWQTFTFGDETSVLFDVAIIDENNIWAVGEIYLKDSLGNPDPTFYNLAKWNGVAWKFEKVYYFYQGNPSLAHLKSIFVFNDKDILIGGFIHWTGNGLESIPLNISFPSDANKIWGKSSKDFYIVGNSGNIAHYQNGSWQKIESGTTSDLLDIYGDEQNIFIAGYRDFKPSVLLKSKDGAFQKIIEEENNLFNYRSDFISGAIKSVWLKNKKLFTLTWFDLYRSEIKTDGTAQAIWKGNIQDWGMVGVRGNDVNDIIACGAFGRVWHYSGITWQRFNELEDNRDLLYKIEIKGNICVAVGYRYENGIERYGLIHIGRR
ncbi:MAG: hypothetical protein NTX22_08905 [Ignavibacteriales bacterium]|nr:hypothetical protein [Ignavibacteriales bacterium]